MDSPAQADGEWPAVGPSTGFPPLAQSLLQCRTGALVTRCTGPAEEVLFVLGGEGSLRVDGASHALDPESGAYVPPDTRYELEASSATGMRIVRVSIPDPPGAGGRPAVRRLAEQERHQATTQREFRIVADPSSGLRSATQFVGYVPPIRAPEHFHTYDEVIHIIDGRGELHAGDLHFPVRAGSSIQLPAGTVHCLENKGPNVMRLVGVFRPAGSPAAAYYPDGTPAHPGAPPITYTHQEEEVK